MATIKIDAMREVSPEKFEKMLRLAMENSSPIDDFIETIKELSFYEQKYDMNSEDFFEKFNKGEMGDDEDFISWAGTYDFFLIRKRRLEIALMKAAVEEIEASST